MNKRKPPHARMKMRSAAPVAILAAMVLGSVFATSTASAEDASAYPTKTIRMALPLPPGGGTDTLARIMAPKMSQLLGQAVVVDNRPGAAGNIATDIVSHATPDGYTILLAINTELTTNPALYKNLNFDVQRDLKPVTLLASAQYVLVVNPSLPVKSVKDLIDYAKAHPGQLNYSSGGTGTPLHLAGELFTYMTHTQITHVPYKGGDPAVLGVLGGQVQLVFGSVAAVMPQVRAGKLRALAVTSPNRSSILPDLPTLSESGLTGYDLSTWYAIMVPKKTPDVIVAKLQAAAQAAARQPDVQKAMGEQGLQLTVENPPEVAKRIKTESLFWADMIHNKMKISAN